MGNNILITGGAGFVGSNLALYLKERIDDVNIICFDNLIRKGSELNVPRLKGVDISFIEGDIRNQEQLLSQRDIEFIIDCAAEPSVLASAQNPQYAIDTNFMGTVNCLELSRRESAKMIFVSTNRVYPILPLASIPCCELETRFDWDKSAEGQGYSFAGINEDFSLLGARSLYGASKLCSELILQEQMNLFGIKGVINRCGIIAGPWQFGKVDQGIMTYWLAAHKRKRALKYIGFGGKGKQVRDALHIDDFCELMLMQINNIDSVNGEIFNVGGGRENSFSLQELTSSVQNITGVTIDILSEEEARKDDLQIYITDNAKVMKTMGWSPKKSVDDIICDSNSWMDNNGDKLENIL